MNGSRKLSGLTVMRFFAATWVCIFHSSLWEGHKGWLAAICSIGYAGVSVFFVLSGFILTYNYFGKEFTVREFWSARVARIAPVYWVALVVSAPFLAVTIARHESALVTNIFLTPLFLQSWATAAPLKWNGPAWSVSTEAFFYFLFPFVVRPAADLFRKWPISILLILWIAGAVPSMLYAIWHPEGVIHVTSSSPLLQTVKFNPLLRLPEFLFGTCIGVGFCDGWRMPVPRLLTPGCVLLASSLLVAAHRSPYPSLHNGLFAPVFGLLILSIASDTDWLDWKPMAVLGEASYSLYILSEPLEAIYHSVARRSHWIPSEAHVAGWAVYFVFTVVVSILTYIKIETPCRRRLRSVLGTRKQLLPANQPAPEP